MTTRLSFPQSGGKELVAVTPHIVVPPSQAKMRFLLPYSTLQNQQNAPPSLLRFTAVGGVTLAAVTATLSCTDPGPTKTQGKNSASALDMATRQSQGSATFLCLGGPTLGRSIHAGIRGVLD